MVGKWGKGARLPRQLPGGPSQGLRSHSGGWRCHGDSLAALPRLEAWFPPQPWGHGAQEVKGLGAS